MFKVLAKGCEPTLGSKYSACVDLYSSEDVVIGAGETKLVGLGVCIDLDLLPIDTESSILKNIPFVMDMDEFLNSHYLQLMLRSSLGAKGLMLANGVGVIDLDYKDEIKMIIHNPIKVFDKNIGVGNQVTEKAIDFKNSFKINKGDKIGQIMLCEHKSYLFGIESDVERDGGFGSTGV